MRVPLTLGRKSDAARSPAVSIERLLNGYLEAQPDGKEPTPIYGTPGLRLFTSGLAGAVRGLFEMAGVLYVVAGTQLYSVASTGVASSLGAVPNTDVVQMDGDGTNVVIVTEGSIYVWNGSAVSLVTDPDAPSASSVVFIDGYFLFGVRNSQQFQICALGDPTSYDALDFASAEWKPDYLVTPIVWRRVVFMMGQETLEAQYNTGAATFPFQRYSDIFIDVGIAGRDAATITNDAMFWLANDFTVRRLDGLTATPISTARISRIIKSWADPSLTVASSHVLDNHLFIMFRNPDGCVVFDQSTGLWHERASFNSATWQVRHHVSCYSLEIFGSATEGKLFVLDSSRFDEDGAVLPFQMVTPYAYAGGNRLTVNELELMVQPGVGSAVLDPQVSCEKTRDGQVWAPRKLRSLGKAGELAKRVQFGPQGMGRQMAFRFTITDAVQRTVLACYADIDAEAT